jgi:hypothetical protein
VFRAPALRQNAPVTVASVRGHGIALGMKPVPVIRKPGGRGDAGTFLADLLDQVDRPFQFGAREVDREEHHFEAGRVFTESTPSV